jgi:CheY-like chemotaxis protein
MMARHFKQLVQLVDDLLDVSRITTGKLELHRDKLDVAAVIRDAIEATRSLIDTKSHEISVELPSEPLFVEADPTRIGQVFRILLNNAAKYSDRGGKIRVSASRLADGAVEVSINDWGIGISASHLPHIFDVFVQADNVWERSQGGLGIGLSLVKEFVTLHGGRVEAFSEGPGQGSEFVVRLPAIVEATEEEPPADSSEVVDCLQHRVLVVDDNRDAAQSLAMMLGVMGHEVRMVHDGEEGVAAAGEFQPDIILLDLGMPKVDGCEVARRIRSEPQGGAPMIVALTGWGGGADP